MQQRQIPFISFLSFRIDLYHLSVLRLIRYPVFLSIRVAGYSMACGVLGALTVGIGVGGGIVFNQGWNDPTTSCYLSFQTLNTAITMKQHLLPTCIIVLYSGKMQYRPIFNI